MTSLSRLLGLVLLLAAIITFTNIARADEKPINREAELIARLEQLERLITEQARQLAELKSSNSRESQLQTRIEQLERLVAEQSQAMARAGIKTEKPESSNDQTAALLARLEKLESQLTNTNTNTDTAKVDTLQQSPLAEDREQARDSRLEQLEKTMAEVRESKFSFNLTGEAGYGRTDNANIFTIGDRRGKYDNTEIGLLFTARPYDFITFAARTEFEEEEVKLDWAFAEIRQSDALRFRFGRVKQPFGIYGEIIDIGTLRPFFTLPQSVYGPAGFTPDAYNGMGITGTFSLGKSSWGIDYDLYGGDLDNPVLEIPETSSFTFEPEDRKKQRTRSHRKAIQRTLRLFDDDDDDDDPPTSGNGEVVEEDLPTEDTQLADALGGRFFVRTPINGLRLGMSAYYGRNKGPSERHSVYGFSAEYLTDVWNVRGELFTLKDRVVNTRNQLVRSGYIEAARFLGQHWQVAGRYERSYTQLGPGRSVPFLSLLEHRDTALGINYWFNPGLVLKFGYHRVNGNRFSRPFFLDDVIQNNNLKKKTNHYEFGIQYSF